MSWAAYVIPYGTEWPTVPRTLNPAAWLDFLTSQSVLLEEKWLVEQLEEGHWNSQDVLQ
jgi:hypothetical protein